MASISRALEEGQTVELTIKISPHPNRSRPMGIVEGTITVGEHTLVISGGAHDHNFDEFLSLFRVLSAGK